MHNLVPHFILENLAKGNLYGEFSAAGLFVDISGFTNITEALMQHGPHGAEVLAELMRGVLDPLIQSVYAHEGMIVGLAGDAFTALFPCDEVNTGACAQALASAFEIQNYIRSNSIFATEYSKFRVSVKVGLSAGEVRWGIVISPNEKRAMYYFQGQAVDGCSECEHYASAGEVIGDSKFYDQVKDLAEVEFAGNFYRFNRAVGLLPPAQIFELPSVDDELQKLFFPEEVLRQNYSGEFRQVVSIFINLPTVRTKSQLEIFLNSLFTLQDRYGGFLNRLDFGDKGSNLLLYWGAPVAYENDIERALNCILDLQIQTSIPINAGITYRIAHAGFIGSVLREEYTCYGHGANLAARFMTAAPRGEIWVDDQIYRRAHARYEIDYRGKQTFKGFTDPVDVYILFERKDQNEGFFQGKFIGRETELETLVDFLDPIKHDNYAGALIIVGEPGIGKSRLVMEFKASEDAFLQMRWAVCQSDEILRDPFNPFRYWLRDYFQVSDSQVEARNKRDFNRKLDHLIAMTEDPELAEELDRTRSFLGALLRLYWPDSLYEQLDAQARYENTLTGLITLIKAESLQQPVVIVLEDMQWLDDDSTAFIPGLARAINSDEKKSYPIAIVGTFRGGEHDLLIKGLDYRLLELKRLSIKELSLLAGDRLEGAVSQDLTGLLSEYAEGNPFFAEQILSFLQEEGLLVRDEKGWLVSKQQEFFLPADVQVILIARLDRLVQEVKEVVQTASILGRVFEVNLLALMLLDDDQLIQEIAVAEQASIWSQLNELRYLFKSAMLRDAAYRMQVRTRRMKLHALAVEAFERLYAKDLSSHFGEIAYHAEQADLVEKAIDYLRLAGNVALDNYQNSVAADYYSRALRLLPEDDIQIRFDLLISRVEAYKFLGELQARLEDLRNLDDLKSRLDEGDEGIRRKAKLAVAWGDYAMERTEYPLAIQSAEQAILLCLAVDTPETAIKAYQTWAVSLLRIGALDEAFEQGSQGLRLARETNNRHGEGVMLSTLGLIVLDMKDAASAREYMIQSLQVARDTGDHRVEGMVLNNLGIAAGNEGDFSSVRNYYEQAFQLAKKIGQRSGQSIVLGNLGWIAGVLGDYTTAREYNEQALKIARETGNTYQEVIILVNLSSTASSQGEFDQAMGYAEQSLALGKSAGVLSLEAWAFTCLGHARYGLGQLLESEEAYQSALAIRNQLYQHALAMEQLAGLARVALASGDVQTAKGYTEKILAYLDGGSTLEGAEEPMRIYLTCFQVLKTIEDPRAVSVLKNAYDILEARAARIREPEARRTFLEVVPYHREIITAFSSGQVARVSK